MRYVFFSKSVFEHVITSRLKLQGIFGKFITLLVFLYPRVEGVGNHLLRFCTGRTMELPYSGLPIRDSINVIIG